MAGNVHEAPSVEAYYRARREHDVFHSTLYSRATKQNNYAVCYKTGMTGALQVGKIYIYTALLALSQLMSINFFNYHTI